MTDDESVTTTDIRIVTFGRVIYVIVSDTHEMSV